VLMFQALAPTQVLSSQQQQSVPASSSAASAANDNGLFWSSPAPSHVIQPTAILQRPSASAQLQQQQQSLQTMNPVSMMQPGSAALNPDFAGDYSQIFEWVSQLLKGPEGREKALLELSRKREQYDDLALILWHSFGTHLLLVSGEFLTDK
jgi:hypothetical protein